MQSNRPLFPTDRFACTSCTTVPGRTVWGVMHSRCSQYTPLHHGDGHLESNADLGQGVEAKRAEAPTGLQRQSSILRTVGPDSLACSCLTPCEARQHSIYMCGVYSCVQCGVEGGRRGCERACACRNCVRCTFAPSLCPVLSSPPALYHTPYAWYIPPLLAWSRCVVCSDGGGKGGVTEQHLKTAVQQCSAPLGL